MCSIIGCISKEDVSPLLVNGLKKMEYRGYDSVGVATNVENNIVLKKDIGRVAEVNEKLNLDTLPGKIGIGHTRWATHGGVTPENAHPHFCLDKKVAVVHNGIIENHKEIRSFLEKEGIIFKSQTDSEVIPNLLCYNLQETPDLKAAVIKTVKELKGQYGFVAMLSDGTLVAAKYHEPLIVGIGKDEYYVSSDVLGFIEKTDDALYLENNQFVIIDQNGLKIYDFDGNPSSYSITKISKKFHDTSKGDYKHFTIKEIFDQPYTLPFAIKETEDMKKFVEILKNASNIYFTGSGTSYHAALVAKYMMPLFTEISPEPIMSSEMKYTKDRLRGLNSVLIAISQSGESADVLEAVSIAKEKNLKVISIVNSINSSLAKESLVTIPLNCGQEVGVGATKSFTSQLGILYKLTSMLSKKDLTLDSNLISRTLTEVLENESSVKNLAKEIKDASDIYILGRGVHYPIAKEGALKIKELSYIHAEGFPTGELKHGPLALMSKSSYVIVINPQDKSHQDNSSSVQEVKARGAKIIGISNTEDSNYDYWIKIPSIEPKILYPLIEIVCLQLLAYHIAIEKGIDPDYPRNLAKSVTVK